MVTKSELKKEGVDGLRVILAEHFDGITKDTTKKEMQDLIDETWQDFLREALNPVEKEAEKEVEEVEEEVEEEILSEKPEGEPQPDPKTDLYTGSWRR